MKNFADVAKQTLDKKNAMSRFLKLSHGESVRIDRIRSYESVMKTLPNGDSKPVVKFTVDVEVPEFGLVAKVFEVGSAKLINDFVDSGVTIGSSFTLTRTGEGLETVYSISDIVNPPSNPLA